MISIKKKIGDGFQFVFGMIKLLLIGEEKEIMEMLIKTLFSMTFQISREVGIIEMVINADEAWRFCDISVFAGANSGIGQTSQKSLEKLSKSF